ncbi:Uncharacterized conserved protein [Paracoccus homiensis]|uniref:Uncharacterized conserved protein n=1 Tax=Paracoccus homiensis TaxID=364199 RepID=A0A1I0ABD1_9RHOB|nr:Uncharacterized conserved protein [Paracoccus homiensis]
MNAARRLATLVVAITAMTPAQSDIRPPERPEPPATAQDPIAPTTETDQDFAACRLALSLLGASFRELDPVSDPDDPECGIARPLQITEILPGLQLDGAPVLRCDTARSLALWAHHALRPSAAALPGAPRLTGLRVGPGYSCRARVGTGATRPRISQHALGNAVDITGFTFDGREPIAVQPRQDSGNLDEAFQRSARATACLFFSTVLGPGSNDAHDDHLHLDVMPRTGGWRLCQ